MTKITTPGEAALQATRLLNYFMTNAQEMGKDEADVVMIAALVGSIEAITKAAITGVQVASIVRHGKAVEGAQLENLHTIVRRAYMWALVTYQCEDPAESLRKFHIIEQLAQDNKDALLEVVEEEIATKVQEDPRDPLVTDWREGETKRLVGNTLVYRTYADKVMD